MSILVGFKRATVGVLDESGKVMAAKKHVIEGKQGEGATTEAQITGLSAEAKKVFGSDIAYYVSQKGVGDLKLEFSALDIPVKMHNDVLGWVKDTVRGFTVVGENTEPPYAAALLESTDADGNPVAIALFKGRFSMDELGLKTKTEDSFEPDAEKTTMNCVSNKDGLSFGMAVGEEEVTKLKAYTFPGDVPAA
ncbi:phage tail protein [Listeria booriae]|uniref:major tail protein n=1 Tax=Listeria booriae TaxID=1552123 RepID=UPI001628A436|nr:major tail protein [Listeria booriae]MBC2369376.1 phage tail protein [Listeria booriae]